MQDQPKPTVALAHALVEQLIVYHIIYQWVGLGAGFGKSHCDLRTTNLPAMLQLKAPLRCAFLRNVTASVLRLSLPWRWTVEVGPHLWLGRWWGRLQQGFEGDNFQVSSCGCCWWTAQANENLIGSPISTSTVGNMVLAITLPSCGSVVPFWFAVWTWFGDVWWWLGVAYGCSMDAFLRLDLSELLICSGCHASGKYVQDSKRHTSKNYDKTQGYVFLRVSAPSWVNGQFQGRIIATWLQSLIVLYLLVRSCGPIRVCGQGIQSLEKWCDVHLFGGTWTILSCWFQLLMHTHTQTDMHTHIIHTSYIHHT